MARVWRAGSPYHGINGSLFAILKEKMPVLPKEILNDDGWLTAQIQQRFQHVSGVNARKQVPFTFRDYLNQRARMYAANVQLSEMGISKPLSVRKEVLSRLKRLGNLKNKEKSLLLLAIPIEAFAAILGRKRYKQGKYARGWTSPRRD